MTPLHDDQNHPCRRHADRLDNLEKRTTHIETRQDGFERDVAVVAKGLQEGAEALRELTRTIERVLPLVETYEDVKGFGRVIAFLVKNAKTIIVTGGCVLVALKSEVVLPAILKALGG